MEDILKPILIFGVLFTMVALACGPQQPRKPAAHFIRPMKYCLDSCIHSTFRNFHNSSYGGGSSSMDGLSQKKIFDRVETYCKEFYKDEKCCEWNREYAEDRNITEIHGWDYGACKNL